MDEAQVSEKISSAIADAFAARDRKEADERAKQAAEREAARIEAEKIRAEADRVRALEQAAELERRKETKRVQAEADAAQAERERLAQVKQQADDEAEAASRAFEKIPRWIARGKTSTGIACEISHVRREPDLVHVRLANGAECWAHMPSLTDVVGTSPEFGKPATSSSAASYAPIKPTRGAPKPSKG